MRSHLVGSSTTADAAAAAAAGLRVHGHACHRERLEVAARRPLRDLELLGDLARSYTAAVFAPLAIARYRLRV